MVVFIGKKFVNGLAKSTIQYMLEKRENVKIIDLPLKCTINSNNLLIILLYLLIYLLCQTSFFGLA